jgi:hypothetical protein
MVVLNNPDQSTQAGPGASPYSTGGGGVVLEHTFAATLLVSLLTGDPVPGLGDGFMPKEVSFQARMASPVDDLVVIGEAQGSGGQTWRQLSIGVRRRPRIARSDTSFVELLRTYIVMVENDWDRIIDGRLRLGLAVSGPHTSAQELAALSTIARTKPDDQQFRAAVSTAGATTARIRSRLELLDQAVSAASNTEDSQISREEHPLATWKLLTSLFIIEMRLEGDIQPDRTQSVTRLRPLCQDPSIASGLFDTLCALAGGYASAGATVTEAMLRRDLSGVVNLSQGPSHQRAWEILHVLSRRLRERTRDSLNSGGTRLALERRTLRDELITAMATASGNTLVVSGQPDVGKSALVQIASDELALRGESILTLSLRDLPESAIDLSSFLGSSIEGVLGSMAVSPIRLLVVDGAEAALEDRFDTLSELARAASSAGLGVVAVTRSDAIGRVTEALTVQGSEEQPAQIEIASLSTSEVGQVVAAFPSLARFAEDSRSASLLARPGLLDLLLRANAMAQLPDSTLSEADVFAAVWFALVRRREQNEPGRGSPDGRETALLNLARRQLVHGPEVSPGDPAAMPSLRSDGLILASGPTAAWQGQEQFETDLIRDFALARLFIREGWESLAAADAPRWSIRAARLACQARLLQAPQGGMNDARKILQEELSQLAETFGSRWGELPLEALITLGPAHDWLRDAWLELLMDDGRGLSQLLRLIEQRYTVGDAADPVITEPIVQLIRDHRVQVQDLSREARDQVSAITLKWIRGLALRLRADAANALRASLRDDLLSGGQDRFSEADLEFLALLGPDMNAEVVSILTDLASTYPHLLAPCVETSPAAMSMAAHHPDLLLQLAQAYYIDLSDPLNYPYDNGVRGHHRVGGFYSRLVAWYYGPFWALLQARPREAIAFINRLLDHAVRCRLQLSAAYGASALPRQADADQRQSGIEIQLPGDRRRWFVGDAAAWSWYRGSSVGPYPCMSALLAVERFADGLLQSAADLRPLTNLLLRDCNNLAMAGLVVGFLVRHINEVTDELDVWLVNPHVWRLEFSRASGDGTFHVQGPDQDDLHGRLNRRWSLREAGTHLTIRAILANDESRLTQLASVADELIERVGESLSDTSAPESQETLTVARMWASVLRAESYEPVRLPNGRLGIQYSPPEADEDFEARQQDMDRGMQQIRLLTTYAHDRERRPADISKLSGDLRLARELSEDPPSFAADFLKDTIPAVAATAVLAFVENRFECQQQDMQWAAGILLDAASATPDSNQFEPSFFSMGADRSAGMALPALLSSLVEERGWLGADCMEDLDHALKRLMTSGTDEVRRATTTGLDHLWRDKCIPRSEDGRRCRHLLALDAIEASIRTCFIGPYDQAIQRRSFARLEGELVEALTTTPTSDVMTSRLTASMAAICRCVASGCCVAERATLLRDAVITAHARGAVAWIHENSVLDQNQEVQRTTSGSMLRVAGCGDVDGFLAYLDIVLEEPTAFHQFVRDVFSEATYDAECRQYLRNVWPTVMQWILEALSAGRAFSMQRRSHDEREWGEAVAAALPTPQLRTEDTDPVATLAVARHDWIGFEALERQISKWLEFAAGIPECTDSMVGYVQTMPPSEQVSRGLGLVSQVVDGQFQRIASHTWLLGEWLETLRSTSPIRGATLAAFQSLVDGLASHGDSHAARIQRSME